MAQGEEKPAADGSMPSVTPEEVRSMGAYLGIDLTKDEDYHLLAVAKEAVIAPVLPPWEEMEDEAGNPYFFNHAYVTQASPPPKRGTCRMLGLTPPPMYSTRQPTRRHPLDAKFLALVQAIRAKATPEGGAGKTWMRFEGADGKVSYHNFKDGSTADECPAEAEIDPLPADMIPQYDASQMGGGTHPTAGFEAGLDQVKTLVFYAWWSDSREEPDRGNGSEVGGGLSKRYITAMFDIDAQTFTVKMENDAEVVLSNLTSVTAKHGMPVQCWDLYVGAKLNLLGKPTTLMQASATTLRWLDWHAKRLRKVKAKILKELSKYNTKALAPAVVYEKGSKVLGGTSLRALMEQVEVLRNMLAKWRPSKAEGVAF